MLTYAEFKATMTDNMLDVTMTATQAVDIWPYVQQLVKDKIVLEYVCDNRLVDSVYRNDQETFDHVLLPTADSNVFTVIIVDLQQKKIKGYYQLDLDREYQPD